MFKSLSNNGMLNKRVWPQPVNHPLTLCHPERSEGPSDGANVVGA